MRDRLLHAAGPALLAAVFVTLAHWSWGKWADVHVDFGNELYVAWRLSEGQVLYRDIAYRNGPLAPYLNAAWFSLFGVSIRTLVVCNLILFAGLCALVFRFFATRTSRLAGTVAGLVLLCTFGFSQYTVVANYNYATPYDHAQTHGLVLSVAMIALLCRGMERRRLLCNAAAGLCLGLVFLTKIELFLPALAASAAALAIGARRGTDLPRRGSDLLAFASGAVLPAVVSLLLLQLAMPVGQALQGTIGNWGFVGTGLLDDAFYRRVTGADQWVGHLVRLLLVGALIGIAALLLALADRASGAAGARLAPLAAAALLALLLWSRPAGAWLALARGLPLVSLLAAAYYSAACLRLRAGRGGDFASAAGLAVWSVFALFALGKMLLNARIGHYGFVLAMPATLLLGVLLVWQVPQVARRGGGRGVLCQWLALALWASWIVFWLQLSNARYQAKTLAVGVGADRIWVEAPSGNPKGLRMAQALLRLDGLMPAGATLLVLPEGASLNYWLRRVNPTRFSLFLPSEFDAFGTETMLDGVRSNPPDYLVLVQRDHREFGVLPFGEDPRFGKSLMRWVEAHYRWEDSIGAEPFGEQGFGITILQRADANPR